MRGTSNRNAPPLSRFHPDAADFPARLSFFLADSSSLMAWGNFEAAKAIVEPVPSRGAPRLPTRDAQGLPGGPGNSSRKNVQLNETISFHGAICIVALCRGTHDSEVEQSTILLGFATWTRKSWIS